MSNEEKLKLLLLGPPRIECEGRVVTTDTRKATALLARLALSGERLSRDLLAAFLWPDASERRAKAALRRTLSDLKSTVGEDALTITREALGIRWDSLTCDVFDFLESARFVRDHDHAGDLACGGCRERLQAAAALYRDDFLAGFSLRDSPPFDDWQLQQTEFLRAEFETALQELIKIVVAEGALEDAIPYAQRWLQLDPLREEAHRQLMKLYAWTGRRTAALKQYRDCVRILEEELGVPPLEETTALYQAIQEERLEAPRPPAPPAPREAAAAPAGIPFLGREAELAAMDAVYDQVGPDGRLLVLAGEVGIGKTSLAEAFLATKGSSSLRARCYPGETHLTYAPFVLALRDGLRKPGAAARLADVAPTALAEAARLLPDLAELVPDLPPPPPLDWPGAQGRFIAGLGEVLAALLSGESPGILWLDDVQWADSASLELLAYLAHRWRERPYLLLVCWRSGDLTEGSQLPQLLAQTRREGSGMLIPLARLDAPVVEQIVGAVVSDQEAVDGGGLGSRLYSETEGLPFLITAYLHALSGESYGAGQKWAMPATVRDLFQSRLATVAETERQILQTAAVIGRACRFELLRTVSGRSEEETIGAIEAALAHLLLVEEPPGLDYDFSHHKLRELVLDEMSLARRRLLHRRVARALAAQHHASETVPSPYAAAIARHYRQAGRDEKAAAYYFQAGSYAYSLFALREALDHLQTALALGYEDTAGLHEISGDLHMRLGEYAAALDSFERAASQSAAARIPVIEHKIGQVYYRLGEWSSAESHFRQARAAAAGDTPGDELARLYIDWSYAAYRSGDIKKSRGLVSEAQPFSASPLAQAQVANILGILARHDGDLQSATAHFAESLRLAEANNLLSMTITAANNLALAQMNDGRTTEALPLFQIALDECRRYGDRHWEAAIHNNLADLYHLLGQEEEAMAELKQAITILAEIGREAGDWQPEIWKLSEW